MTIGAAAGVITFINTRDPEKARAFYGETLGFKFIADDGFAHVFDLNGTTLRITKIDNHVAQGHPVLGWTVEDIEGTIRRLVARGVTMTIYPGLGQDELGIWTAPDGKAKVAFFNDPDGNALSLTSV